MMTAKAFPEDSLIPRHVSIFFDKICTDAGVKMLFHSQVAAINMDGDRIDGIFLATECGNYSLTADVYIDATGNGIIAGFAGCEWDCGDPVEKNPSPTSYGIYVMGMPTDFSEPILPLQRPNITTFSQKTI